MSDPSRCEPGTASGWHHSAFDGGVAHCFADGKPVCGDRSLGEARRVNDPARFIGTICCHCRRIITERVVEAITKRRQEAAHG